MEYVVAALKRCDRLIIGVTNPDEGTLQHDDANPHRSMASNNPFTFFERLEMIRDSLLYIDIRRERFEIVPFPITLPGSVRAYIPADATVFFTIYDAWGKKKEEVIAGLGFKTCVLWERPEEAKITSGSEVRARIASGEEWIHLVPYPVYRYIVGYSLECRIRKAQNDDTATS
jgi:nicotinamide mononucleotide adenylyltransferase